MVQVCLADPDFEDLLPFTFFIDLTAFFFCFFSLLFSFFFCFLSTFFLIDFAFLFPFFEVFFTFPDLVFLEDFLPFLDLLLFSFLRAFFAAFLSAFLVASLFAGFASLTSLISRSSASLI